MVQVNGELLSSRRRILPDHQLALRVRDLVHPQHWVSATAISGIFGVRGPLLVQQFCSSSDPRRLRGAKEKSMFWQNMIQSQHGLVSPEKLKGSVNQNFLHI